VQEGETKVLDLPPDETGPVPVTVARAERRYYGVTPTWLALAVAAAAVVGAIVLFATGHWPVALILLGVGLLLALLSVETDVFRDRAGGRGRLGRNARPRDHTHPRGAARAQKNGCFAGTSPVRAWRCGVP
jgi:hypothetical protein